MQQNHRLAVREYLATGKPLTELESNVIFGVTSLTDLVSSLRKEGWVFQSRRITYAAALRRINEFTVLQPPKDLPIREIMLTEWWVSL